MGRSTDRATDKARRQRAILDLVEREPIGSQDELARALTRAGFSVAQSTLSRDLKELRVSRAPQDDGYRYVAPARTPPPSPRGLGSMAGIEVTGVSSNETCVVVRTLVGRAQGVAVYLDGLDLAEILGTVAGDDTILVLPASTSMTAQLERRLLELFGLRPTSVEAAGGR